MSRIQFQKVDEQMQKFTVTKAKRDQVKLPWLCLEKPLAASQQVFVLTVFYLRNTFII